MKFNQLMDFLYYLEWDFPSKCDWYETLWN